MEKTQEGFEDSDMKVDLDTQHVVTTTKTPGFVEEISFEKRMEIGVLEPKYLVFSRTHSQHKNIEAANW